ncbi:MAG TPA: HAMP domain-containing sensor histidine kinase, partial [Magnetovibrio sp.]
SHELRTPMNAIIGYGEMLHYDIKGPMSSEQHEYLGYILDSARHLLRLINQVLELNKIEAGALAVEIVPIIVADAVIGVKSFVSSQAQKKKVKIHTEIEDGEVLQVYADELMLRQTLINLMGNAVKYNVDGGRVDIVGKRVEPGWVRIAVTDTGPGITKEQQAHIFAPFERLSFDQSDVEGTGIGLLITKNLVEAMGGRIGIESQAMAGATFWIELPTAPLA